MNLSAPFIARPVATTLLTIGLALAGLVAFFGLPVSPLPKVDFPTIQVTATLPGVSIDNWFFGVSSVGADGHASPVEFPGQVGAFVITPPPARP